MNRYTVTTLQAYPMNQVLLSVAAPDTDNI